MEVTTALVRYYAEAKANKWIRYFTVFCRVVLAAGFIPSGIVKVMGERFTALPPNHPLGHYFDALHLTGYYYTFIGVAQLIAALLLLIPRTALLGALVYFPIIVNICVLAYAVRFEGTRITTLMLLADLYLLCWDYDRLRHILPFDRPKPAQRTQQLPVRSKFPYAFFVLVIAIAGAVVAVNHFLYELRPGNSKLECTNGCRGSETPEACASFCDCIYNDGKPLQTCLDAYEHNKQSEQINTNKQP